jgi:hypothetical protein
MLTIANVVQEAQAEIEFAKLEQAQKANPQPKETFWSNPIREWEEIASD